MFNRSVSTLPIEVRIYKDWAKPAPIAATEPSKPKPITKKELATAMAVIKAAQGIRKFAVINRSLLKKIIVLELFLMALPLL